MVARLVQDQKVWLRQPCACQCHPHRLATAERVRRRTRIAPAQAVLFQGSGECVMRGPALADPFEISRFHAAVRNAVQRIQKRRHAGQRGNALPRRGAHALRQVMRAAGTNAAPGTGRQRTGQDAAKHALAHAIATDQAGAALIDVRGEIRKQRAAIGQQIRNAFQRQRRTGHRLLHCMPARAPIQPERQRVRPSSRRRHQ